MEKVKSYSLLFYGYERNLSNNLDYKYYQEINFKNLGGLE